MKNIALAIATLCALLFGSGCQPPSAAIVPVSGRITFDGVPLAAATVTFQPVTSKASTSQAGTGSYGKTDADGRFTLWLVDPDQPGALVGKHQVTFTTAVADPAADGLKLTQRERLPARCRTQEFEVPPGGTDQANFALRSN